MKMRKRFEDLINRLDKARYNCTSTGDKKAIDEAKEIIEKYSRLTEIWRKEFCDGTEK